MVGGTIPGLVTLGCLRKQCEQARESKAYHTTVPVYQFTQADGRHLSSKKHKVL